MPDSAQNPNPVELLKIQAQLLNNLCKLQELQRREIIQKLDDHPNKKQIRILSRVVRITLVSAILASLLAGLAFWWHLSTMMINYSSLWEYMLGKASFRSGGEGELITSAVLLGFGGYVLIFSFAWGIIAFIITSLEMIIEIISHTFQRQHNESIQ